MLIIIYCNIHGFLSHEQLAKYGKRKNKQRYRCKECQNKKRQTYLKKNKQIALKIWRNSYSKNKQTEKFRNKRIEKFKKHRENITPYYARKLLRDSGFYNDMITPDLIALKQALIEMKRLAKKLNDNKQ